MDGIKSAALRAKVEAMWAAVQKNGDGLVERLTCWAFIMADNEIARLVGAGSPRKGRRVLLAMKNARALDVDGAGPWWLRVECQRIEECTCLCIVCARACMRAWGPAHQTRTLSRTRPGDGMIDQSEFHRLLEHHRFYAHHPEDHVHSLKHLSASGGAAGLLKSLKTPPGLHGAQLVLFKLAQKVGMDGDAKSSGFGTTYHPAHVNYYQQFRLLDIDGDRAIELDEFNRTIRKALGISARECSDDEIVFMFEAMDDLGTGRVSLKEFSAFAKGAAQSSAYHGELTVFQQRGTDTTSGGAEGSGDVLSKPLTEAEVAALEEDPKKGGMLKGLSDKKAGRAEDAAATGLDAVHLVLWHLAQHVAYETDSAHSSGNAKEALATHPGNVSYAKLFGALDIDKNGDITRDEWAIVLRRRIGVGDRVSDADLESIFDAINTGHSGGISLAEFAAFARGASASAMARGVSHEKAKAATTAAVVQAPSSEGAALP